MHTQKRNGQAKPVDIVALDLQPLKLSVRYFSSLSSKEISKIHFSKRIQRKEIEEKRTNERKLRKVNESLENEERFQERIVSFCFSYRSMTSTLKFNFGSPKFHDLASIRSS